MPNEAAYLAPFSTLTVATMAKVLVEQGIETENLPKSKKRMAYSLSWALPHGLPVVVQEHEWPDKHKHVPFVNRPFESEIHGTVNFTQFCCVLLVTWCYRVLLSCYLRPK